MWFHMLKEMKTMRTIFAMGMIANLILVFLITPAFGASAAYKDNIYNPGQLKPIDSQLKVSVGEPAPDFTLPSVAGEKITLSQFKGKKMS